MIYENFDLVIFDFDGTLYDLKGFTPKFLRRVGFPGILWASKERKLRHEIMGNFYGGKDGFDRNYFEKLGALCKKDPSKVQNWYEKKYMAAMLKTLQKDFSARAGVHEVFDLIHSEGKKLVVFSDYSLVKERVEAVGIDVSRIDGFYSAGDLGGLKPAREPFLKIAGDFGVAPEKCLVIGDRPDTDGLGAERTGMSFELVRSQENFNRLLPASRSV